MDPNANLREQRERARQIIAMLDADDPIDPNDAGRLADLVEALDDWITSGGFLPDRWQIAQKRGDRT